MEVFSMPVWVYRDHSMTGYEADKVCLFLGKLWWRVAWSAALGMAYDITDGERENNTFLDGCVDVTQ